MSGLETGRRAPFAMVPEWILLADVSPQAKALYVLLVAHTNSLRGDGLAWPGMEAMAAILGYRKRQTVGKYVRELEELGAIDVHMTISKNGRRNTYVVHETPPEGYTGHASLSAFYAHPSDLANPSGNPYGKGPETGGGPLQGTTHSPPQGTMGSPPQRTRTRRSEPPEGEPNEQGTSSGGAHAMAQPDGRARITGAQLAKLPQRTITQKLTSVWCAVVLEHGGELPGQETEGWGVEDTHVYTRGKHGIGSQIKAWVESMDLTPGNLEAALTQIREHAEAWATKRRTAA